MSECTANRVESIICRISTQNIPVVALDGTVLEGSFPKNKLKLLEAWIVIHHEDLEANWKLLSNGEQFFRIDPLK